MPLQQITQKEYNKIKWHRKLAGGQIGIMIDHIGGKYWKHEAGMEGTRAFAELRKKAKEEATSQLTLFGD